MNFFRTIGGLCKGPSFMPRLLEVSPWKALLHALLFCILLAPLTGYVQSRFLNADVDRYMAAFAEQFGTIQIRGDAFIPSRNREQPAVFLLQEGAARFDYLTKDSLSSQLEGFSGWTARTGVFWKDGAFYLWLKTEPDRILLMGIQPPAVPEFRTEREIRTILQERTLSPETVKHSPSAAEMTFADLGKEIRSVVFFSLAFGRAMLSGFILLTTVLLFSIIQFLFRANGLEKLRFSQMMTIMAYSTVPALIISSVFAAFSLPLISPETAFFAVFFFYHLMSFNAVRKTLP